MGLYDLIVEYVSKVPYLDNKWFHVLGVAIVFYIIAWIITWIFKTYILAFAQKSKTKVDDIIVSKVRPPFTYILVAIGVRASLTKLQISEIWFIKIIDSILILAAAFVVMAILDVIMEVWAHKFAKKTRSRMDDTLLPLFKRFSYVTFFIIALLMILALWGVDIRPLMASAGVAGLAIGLALQEPLKNIFTGVSLILDKNMQVGDKIDINGVNGIVHDIGLRSTKVKNWDNEIVILPNIVVGNAQIRNYTQPNSQVRVTVHFSVEYGTDPNRLEKLLLPILKKCPDFAEKPAPGIDFLSMGDSGLMFMAKYWVNDYTQAYGSKLEATTKIYAALNKAGIGIPFPTRTVYMHEVKGKQKSKK